MRPSPPVRRAWSASGAAPSSRAPPPGSGCARSSTTPLRQPTRRTVVAESTAARLRRVRPFTVEGSLARVTGHELELRGLRLSVGDTITVTTADGDRPGEVVALGSDGARALVLGESAGLARGDRVRLHDGGVTATVSRALVGRVIDG